MKRTKETWVALALMAVVFSVLAVWAMMVFAEASRVAEESAQRALLDEAAALLDAHHSRHGRYPETLESLAFSFPDGSDKSTLASLHYESDGKSYSLVARGAYSGDEHRKSGP